MVHVPFVPPIGESLQVLLLMVLLLLVLLRDELTGSRTRQVGEHVV
jgi:hypothetical protein